MAVGSSISPIICREPLASQACENLTGDKAIAVPSVYGVGPKFHGSLALQFQEARSQKISWVPQAP